MAESERRLLRPACGERTNPRLIFADGQFLFSSTNLEGGLVERFLSNEAVREAFSGIPVDSGWLRPEIARWGNGRLGEWAVAFMPPQVYELELTRESATDTGWKLETNLDHIRAPLPGLVLFGHSNQYFIWAVKTDKLDPYQEIYRCPLPNVEASGLICWGPFKPPRATATSIFEAFELFSKSTFNNHRCNGKSKREREDVRVLLRELSTQHSALGTQFPVRDLMRQVDHVGATLDAAIRSYFENGEMPV